MLKNLNEYHDPRYEKISFYVIRTALILVLAGAVMYWVFGKAGNILRLVLAVVNPLIVGIGLNLIFEKTFHLANYLPALVIAVLWGLFIG